MGNNKPGFFNILQIFIISSYSFFGVFTFHSSQTTIAGETSFPLKIVRSGGLNYHPFAPLSIFQRYMLQTHLSMQMEHQGVLQTSGTSDLKLKWNTNIDEAILFMPLINTEGTIGYVVSNDQDIETKKPKGKLYAFNLMDGSIRWQFESQAIITASPIVAADGTIFIVANIEDPKTNLTNGVIFAISEEGGKKWSFKADGNIFSQPILGPDGTLFFGTTKGNKGFLYAINPLSVTNSDAIMPDWIFETKGGIVSSPLITERGVIFVGTAEGEDTGHIFAIGMDQGDLRWEFQTEGPILSSPVKKDNSLFVGISMMDLANANGNETQFTLRGKAIAFDIDNVEPEDVRPQWSQELSGGIFFSPLVVENTIFVGTTDVMLTLPEDTVDDIKDIIDIIEDIEAPTGSLFALNIADGNVKWDIDLESVPVSSPVIGPDNTILITTDKIDLQERTLAARFFAITPEGKKRLSLSFDGQGIFSAPVVDQDRIIYIGSTGFSIREGLLASLNVISLDSGKAGSFKAKGAILSSSVVKVNDATNEKVIYFGTGDIEGDLKSQDIEGFSGVFYAIMAERNRVEPRPSAITIDEVDPTVAVLGTPVKISGNISPTPSAKVLVKITISDSLGRIFNEMAVTDDSGRFVISGMLVQGGEWKAVASWQGDAKLKGAISKPAPFIINKADTVLTMDVSSLQIQTRDRLEIKGTIKPDPDTPFSRGLLVGSPIKLIRIGPNNDVDAVIASSEISKVEVKYKFPDISLVQPGVWRLIASFEENNPNFNKSNLAEAQVSVTGAKGDKIGYAILVQGRVQSESGIESHNLTANKIRQQLLACGFKDDDILYYNFNDTQEGVDAIPTKKVIREAITISARDRMNLLPAPLYIILIGHGKEDLFPIFPDGLKPEELAQAISELENRLNKEAMNEKIIIVLGAPHSGSFIGELSGSNRIIITSSDTREVSFKGPLAPRENIPDGDFFVSEFFKHAARGASLKNSYENATLAAMTFARNKDGNGLNGADSGNGSFNDDAAFHPLLDDNGDGRGSNGQLSATSGKDGALAANLSLCINPNEDSVEITNVVPLITLAPDEPDPLLKAKVTDPEQIDKIWNLIKMPDFRLGFDKASTEQAKLDIPPFPGTFNPAEGQFEWPDLNERGFSGFIEGGEYQVMYFIRDKSSGDNALFDPKTSQTIIVRNSDPSNRPPASFSLQSPPDGSNTSIALGFSWGESGNNNQEIMSSRRHDQGITQETDDKISDITFNLLISRDETFNSVDHQLSDLSDNFTFIDTRAKLLFDTRYFWKVIAVDEKGAFTPASEGRFSFVTTTSAGFPGFVKGFVKERDTGAPLTAATVRLLDRNEGFTTQDDGTYFFQLLSGKYTFEVEMVDFKTQKASITVNSFETTTRDFFLEREKVGGSPRPSSLTVEPTTAGRSIKMQEAIVTMLDQSGQPLPGVLVNASKSGRGVRVRPSSQTTDANGTARFRFKFGLRSDNGKITFSADGLSATITQQ